MKAYPSIPGISKANAIGQHGFAFEKYDGSNLRFEWSKKRGWWKFGTRTRLFDHTDSVFGSAIPYFMEHIAEPMTERLSDEFVGVQSSVVFCEFLGQKSFAGHHVDDDPKRLVVIDVVADKKGIIGPARFLDLTEGLEFAPRLVYSGVLDNHFVQRVRNNDFAPKLNEGVVVKGGDGHRLWMTKIKTLEYLERLKAQFEEVDQYWE